MSPEESKQRREWTRWFGGGSVLLAALMMAGFIWLPKAASCCPGDADCCERDDNESINVNVGTLNIRSGPSTGGHQALVDAVNGLATAFTPLQAELSVDGISVESIAATSTAIALIAKSLRSPIDVSVSGLDGCGSEDCQASVFVAGDLNWLHGVTKAQAEACQVAWVGRVCGFRVAEADGEGADGLLHSSLDTVKTRIEAWGDEGRLKWLALVGRADRMPFIDEKYGDNRGLAQARARWVHGQLGKLKGASVVADVLKARTLLIGAGPLNVPCGDDGANCDDSDRRLRDRSVDVLACVVPAAPSQSGTGDMAYDADGCGGPVGWSRRVEGTSATPPNGSVASDHQADHD